LCTKFLKIYPNEGLNTLKKGHITFSLKFEKKKHKGYQNKETIKKNKRLKKQ
jgi:hypothetical protein